MADEIFKLIEKEKQRQHDTLMMIPSENITYPEVREAVGSVLMHKYAEGQVGKRYYEGNEVVDEVELIAKQRALEAFNLPKDKWSANVQALSGSPANLAVFNALLKPGDKILSLYLPDGGHLSHGWQVGLRKVTLVSKIYDVHFYKLNPKTQKIDYKELEKLTAKIKPKIIVTGGTAYPFEISHNRLSTISKKHGAYYLADIAHEAGLVIARAQKSPFPYADVVTMTTHKTLRGPRGAIIIGNKKLMEKIDASVFPGMQGGPHLHTIAGIAVALKNAKTASFTNYAHRTVSNAKQLAKKLVEKGFDVVGNGTEKHLVVVDLRNKKINGHVMARALSKVGIICNKNTVPGEELPPMYPSGIRLGTPVISLRGMHYREIIKIVDMIDEVANHIGELELSRDKGIRDIQLEKFEQSLKKDVFYKSLEKRVKLICDKFPLKLE